MTQEAFIGPWLPLVPQWERSGRPRLVTDRRWGVSWEPVPPLHLRRGEPQARSRGPPYIIKRPSGLSSLGIQSRQFVCPRRCAGFPLGENSAAEAYGRSRARKATQGPGRTARERTACVAALSRPPGWGVRLRLGPFSSADPAQRSGFRFGALEASVRGKETRSRHLRMEPEVPHRCGYWTRSLARSEFGALGRVTGDPREGGIYQCLPLEQPCKRDG